LERKQDVLATSLQTVADSCDTIPTVD